MCVDELAGNTVEKAPAKLAAPKSNMFGQYSH